MIVKKSAAFTPVALSITLETKEEAQAFYAIFNNWSNSRLLSADDSRTLLKMIGDHYYVSDGNMIAKDVMYEEFYQAESGKDERR